MMKELMNIGLHNHMTTVLNAHLLVIDGKIYKDRSGEYGGAGVMANIIEIPAAEIISKVTMESFEAGTIMTYDNAGKKIVLISTVPIKFKSIK